MTVELTHEQEQHASDVDDNIADLIARLTPEEVEWLWSALIQIKPHLQD